MPPLVDYRFPTFYIIFNFLQYFPRFPSAVIPCVKTWSQIAENAQ